MFSAATKTDTSGEPTFVENVFATTLYTGTGLTQTVNSFIPTGRFPVTYQTNTGNGTSFNETIPTQSGDWVIVFLSAATAPTCTVNGAAITQSSSAVVDSNTVRVFITQTTSTVTTVTSSSLTIGSITVLRGPTSVTVGTGVTAVIGTSITASAVATTGYGLLLLMDNDVVTPTISVDNGSFSVFQSTTTMAIFGINGDGTNTLSRTVSGLNAANRTGYAVLKCEGSGTTVSSSSPENNGGMVWIKNRTGTATDHAIYDTVRGATLDIGSNLTAAQTLQTTGVTGFSTGGFTIGALAKINTAAATYAAWTFRRQPKFFDVVTYTGNGANRTIAHALGSVPGCIFVKRTDAAGDWQVYHRGIPNTNYLVLNTTAGVVAGAQGAARWNSTTPTESVFSLGTDVSVNANGNTYVAYLFAHDAGGFGLTGTDNVITCGSYTGNGLAAGPTISLGYEPQFLIVKRTTFGTATNWAMVDNMRGWVSGAVEKYMIPNATTIDTDLEFVSLLPNGFAITTTNTICNASGEVYVYIAVRRGPMKTPTSGTEVLAISARTGTGANATVSGGLVSDAIIVKNRGSAIASLIASRLSGTGYMVSSTTAAEVAAGATILQANPWDVMNGVKLGTTSTITNASAATFINYLLRRAPRVFDVVCYTGTGANTTVPHNLGAVPQLMIVKSRSAINAWSVYSSDDPTGLMTLNTDAPIGAAATVWNNTRPTASVFTVGTNAAVNTSAATYIAYLFATLAGVSKIGIYVGANATKNIDCGFTNGARFVLVKQIDAVNNWFIWDTARGISTANDPYWLTNAAAAEVTTTDWIEPLSSGFQVSGNASNPINTATAATWTARTPGFTSPAFINTGVFGAGLFAAGGDNGQIRTSPTGATWTARTSQFGTDSIFGLTFDNNQFVAVGTTGKISTSPTGATWTARTSTTSSELRCVAFGGGVWAALGGAGTFVCTSTDNGVTWTRTNIATVSGASAGNIVYGNGVFVSVGGNSTIKRSTDGVNWTVVQTGTGGVFGVSNNMFALTFAEGQFIAASVLGGVARSTDGLTWTLVGSLPTNRYPVCFTYASGALYAAIENVTGSGVTDIYVSENLGTTWTLTATSVVAGSPAFLAYGTFTFMAAQFGGTAATAPSASYVYLAIA